MFYVIKNSAEILHTAETWLDAMEWLQANIPANQGERPTVDRLLRDTSFLHSVNLAIGAGHFTVSDTPPAAHSALGASSCERWWNCPASVRLSLGVMGRSSAAAEAGTAAHAVAAQCLTTGQDAESFIDRTVEGVLITPELAEAVQIYLDGCREWIQRPGAVWGTEQRVSLHKLNPPVPMFGTVDFWAWDADTRTLHVADFKSGRHAVPVTGNKQLLYYATGLLLLGTESPIGMPETVSFAIYQPAAGGVKRATATRAELHAFQDDLIRAAQRAAEPDSLAVAGTWCHFCPVSGQCSEQSRQALADAQAAFDEFDRCVTPEVRLLTPAERGQIWRHAPTIRAFLDAVGKAIEAAPDGTGWRVGQRLGLRTWADETQAAQVLAAVYDVDPMTAPAVVPPAEAVRRLATAIRPDHRTNKAATEAASAALGPLIVRPVSGTVLIPDTPTPRPGESRGAEFEDSTHE